MQVHEEARLRGETLTRGEEQVRGEVLPRGEEQERGEALPSREAQARGEVTPVLVADDLSVGYGRTAIVRDVNIAVHPGHVVTLIGPNGAGKSTILKTMTGQLPPLGGNVLLDGCDLAHMTGKERSQSLSVLLTDRVQTELMTCEEVVQMGRYPYTGHLGLLSSDDLDTAREAMELVQVWDLRANDFMQISDGQRQRVMLARAICQEPRVMVLDEPTNHLDIRYQIALIKLLRHLAHSKKVGILMTLHELPVAYRASDWLVCVKDGGVLTQGTPQDIFVPTVIDDLFDLEAGAFDALSGDISLSETGFSAQQGNSELDALGEKDISASQSNNRIEAGDETGYSAQQCNSELDVHAETGFSPQQSNKEPYEEA